MKIEKLISGAYGLSHSEDGSTVLIKGALPGEEVDIRNIRKKGLTTFAEASSVNVESPERTAPACPYYGICGGCDFLIVSPETSARLKEECIKDNLKRITGLTEMPPFDPPVYGEFEGYRTRARVHVDPKKKRIGFLREGSNELIEIDRCPALSEKLNAAIAEKDAILKRARSIMFEKGMNKNTHCVEVPLQEGEDGVSMGREEVTALGYKVSASVFFQSNLRLLPELLSYVKENVVGDRIMDLYSGVGTFSRAFEGEDKEVVAVERQKECLLMSYRNAPSAESFTDDVLQFSKRNRKKVDTVIVDPPRVGLDRNVPGLISSWKPERVIYVSCDSTTACRDLRSFSEYRISKARVFDFYPGSSHEESVYILDRI